MAKADIAIDKHTSGIRTAMMQNIAHSPESCFIDLFTRSWGKCDTADAAHTNVKRKNAVLIAELLGSTARLNPDSRIVLRKIEIATIIAGLGPRFGVYRIRRRVYVKCDRRESGKG